MRSCLIETEERKPVEIVVVNLVLVYPKLSDTKKSKENRKLEKGDALKLEL